MTGTTGNATLQMRIATGKVPSNSSVNSNARIGDFIIQKITFGNEKKKGKRNFKYSFRLSKKFHSMYRHYHIVEYI